MKILKKIFFFPTNLISTLYLFISAFFILFKYLKENNNAENFKVSDIYPFLHTWKQNIDEQTKNINPIICICFWIYVLRIIIF